MQAIESDLTATALVLESRGARVVIVCELFLQGFPETFAIGYTNGTVGYLPRAEDYPEGGWRLDEAYAVPDLIFQVHPHPVALSRAPRLTRQPRPS